MADENRSKLGIYTTVAAAVVIVAGTIYVLNSGEPDMPEPKPVAMTPPAQVEQTPAQIEPEPQIVEEAEPELPAEPEPVETPMVTAPPKPDKPALPDLNKSDALVKSDIESAYQRPQIDALFNQEDLIRKFVVFVDNAAQGSLAQQFSPVVKPKSDLKVIATSNDQYILDPQSFNRYDPYVSIFTLTNTETLVDYFKKFQPLINQAYEEIGYSGDDFEQSLIDAIDIALATPLVEGEIKLVAPSAMYKFADPELEALQPIQKLLIRMGPKNQLKVQAALEKIRKDLVK